jgi:hypothetical protein
MSLLALADSPLVSSPLLASPLAASSLTNSSRSPLSATALSLGKAPSLASALAAAVRPQIRGGFKNYGGFGLVQRIDDDRLVAYESQSGSYFSQGRRGLFERLRFDPWKTMSPELARQTPPTLTPQQRARLIEEIRTLMQPLQRKVQRIYFRPLTEERSFNGIPGRGYRLTQMVNVGGMSSGQAQWLRVNFEWWVGQLAGDDVVMQQFSEAAQENLRGVAWPTTSMWINEALALSRYPADPEWRAALRTFAPSGATPENALTSGSLATAALSPRIGATPLYMAATVVMPPLQRSQMGDVRLEIYLTQRSTDALKETVFAAPTGYKEVKLELMLKELDPVLDGRVLSSIWDAVF